PHATRNRAPARDDEGRRGGVEARQLLAVRMRHVGRLLDADRAVQPALVRPWRRLDGQVAEVLPVVPLDVERRQELGIEVPRREAEGVAMVVTDDGGDV